MIEKEYINTIQTSLSKLYPNPKSSLSFTNPLELIVAVILSAQCTDKRVNIVTKDLFVKYRTLEDYAQSTDLEEDIKSINFYRNKAKNIKNMAIMLIEKYEGKVPNTMEELISLPGVARKTANVVLSQAFSINAGFVVDTHVKRVTKRLGLTKNDDPVKVENDLMQLFPKSEWGKLSLQFIFLGRDICIARNPMCAQCPFAQICPSSRVLTQ